MGTGGLANQSLFDKFENILQRMGIVLSFDDTASEEIGRYTLPPIQEIEYEPQVTDRIGEDTTQRSQRKRRASFNSMYDVNDDATQRYGYRPSSRSSMSRLDPGKPDFMEVDVEPRNRRAQQDPATPLDNNQLLAQFLEMGRRLMGGLDTTSKEQKLPNNDLPVQTAANEYSNSSPRPASRSDSGIMRQMDGNPSSQHDRNVYPEDMVVFDNVNPKPSLSDMLRDASSFSTYRKRVTARNIISYWLDQATRSQQRNREMETVAINQDRSALLRQALDLWRAELERKRQNSRTKRFFRHLEKRAAKARDLYLMTKAFSHWAQLTSDEISKASIARGHILSIKYFNAWREITAVNGMKAQRFAVQKPLDSWRRRIQQIRELNEHAIVTHEHNMKRRFFMLMRSNFYFEHRAPEWSDFRLIKGSFLAWIRALRTQREREADIDLSNRQELLHAALKTWSYRLRVVNAAQFDAETSHRNKLLGEQVEVWNAQTRLQPAAIQTATKRDTRVLKTTLTQWRLRNDSMQQAKEADRLRVLRNAWTTWNDHLRCYALKERIDERLKKEAIYRWVLAERYRLAQRIRDQRIQRETFAQFIFTVRDTSKELLQREEQYTRLYNEDLARSALECWRNKLAVQRQREYAAMEFYVPRIEQEAITIWGSKYQHLQNLDKWSRDARFYFVTTKFVKLWHNAALDASKKRRQDAYAKIRRKVKMNIAASALRVWYDKSQRMTNLHKQANELHQTKLIIYSAELIGRWSDKTAKVIQDTQDAEVYYHRQLAYHQLTRWMDEYETYRGMEEQADGMSLIRVSGVASASLRKLSLRIFQIRSAAEMAESMHDRVSRKHHRNMLRHWSAKLRARRIEQEGYEPTGIDIVTHEPNTPGTAMISESADETLNMSDLGSLPDFRLASTTPTATPGYLASPSRRAARARMLAQMSTTPATPLFTPFASRLRAALDGEKYGSENKTRSRRGSMATMVRFAIEEPESPSEGRKSLSRRD